MQPNLGRFPGEIELTFFRIVQEALANVHRHSGSSNVTIALSRDGDSATLEVRDHGAGLPPEVLDAVSAPAKGSAHVGVGIAGMRERVRQLRGRMDISSDADGTIVRAVLPTSEPEAIPVASCCGPECGCPVCGPGENRAAAQCNPVPRFLTRDAA